MSITASTRLIKVEPVDPPTEAANPVDVGSYPVYLQNARREYPNVMFSDAYTDDDDLKPFGYAVVYESDRPTGDVVDRGQPTLNADDGKWYDTWTARDFTDDELAMNLQVAKDNALVALDTARYSTYELGYSDTVGDVTNVYSLTAENQQLLTAMRLLADSTDDETREFTLRTLDNRSVKANAVEVERVTLAVLEHCLAILESLWTLADQVVAATKIEDIPTIPDTFA